MIPLGLATKLGGALVVVLGFKFFVASIEQRGVDKCQAGYAAALAKAQQEDARTLVLKHDRNLEIANADQLRTQRDASVVADLRGRVQRLQQYAAAASSATAQEPSASSVADEASQLRRLLAEGTERVASLGALVAEGRASAVALSGQVTGLQEYVGRVCGAEHDDDSR